MSLPKFIVDILERCSWWKEHRKCEKCPKGSNYHNRCPLIGEAFGSAWDKLKEEEDV